MSPKCNRLRCLLTCKSATNSWCYHFVSSHSLLSFQPGGPVISAAECCEFAFPNDLFSCRVGFRPNMIQQKYPSFLERSHSYRAGQWERGAQRPHELRWKQPDVARKHRLPWPSRVSSCRISLDLGLSTSVRVNVSFLMTSLATSIKPSASQVNFTCLKLSLAFCHGPCSQ